MTRFLLGKMIIVQTESSFVINKICVQYLTSPSVIPVIYHTCESFNVFKEDVMVIEGILSIILRTKAVILVSNDCNVVQCILVLHSVVLVLASTVGVSKLQPFEGLRCKLSQTR